MNEVASEVWKRVKIGDAFDTVTGNTPPKSEKQFYGDAIPLVKPPELLNGDTSDASDGLSEEGRKVSRIAPTGSVFVSCIGNLGKIGLAARELAFNQQINAIMPNRSKAEPKFVFYYCLSPTFSEQLEALSSGTTVAIVNKSRFNSIEMPLPPLTEQKRIVAVLDQAFAALDRARANAEANLADVEELFGGAVDAAIHRLANGREESLRLGSIVTRLTNGYVGPTRDIYTDEGVPYLLARHVRDNHLRFDGKTYVSDDFNEKNKKSKLKVDDVLLVQSGHIGHSAVVPSDHDGHNCHAMIVLTTIKETLSGEYLSAVFNTPGMQKRFQDIRTGSTVPHLTCKMVKELMISVPPLPVQGEVLSEIRRLRLQSAKLKKEYESEISDLDDLRQSVLQKAFVGELA